MTIPVVYRFVVNHLLDRCWGAFFAGAAIFVLATSDVGLNLWIATGGTATMFVVLYVAALIGVVVDPDEVRQHGLAAGLSVLVWGGRAAAFVDLELWGAVAERSALLVASLTLHFMAARRIGHAHARAEQGLSLDRL